MAFYTENAKTFRFPDLPNNKPKVKKAFANGFLKAARTNGLTDAQVEYLWKLAASPRPDLGKVG